MNNIHNTRRRIRNRKYQIYENKEPHHLFRFIYRTAIVLMSVCVIGLTLAINEKVGLVDLPKNIMNINFNKISEWLPFEDWFSLKDEKVSAKPSYALLKDDLYANGTNSAYAILDGVILHIQDEKDNTKTITVRHDNGVIAAYGKLLNSDAKVDERIRKGDVIGAFQDSVQITFLKNEKKINLETALSS